jgi:CheY-like chemotaxis protein
VCELGHPNAVAFLVVVNNLSDLPLTAAQLQADLPLTAAQLQAKGIRNQVQVVAGSQAALAFLRRQPPYERAVGPDVIVLHANLPASEGDQVLLEVNTNAALKHLPVLILNAFAPQPDLLDILALPLQKSVRFAQDRPGDRGPEGSPSPAAQ